MRSLQCERSRSWISLRFDGELSEFEAIKLDRHLGRCATCRAFAAEVGAATRLLRSIPLEPLTAQVAIPGRIPSRRRSATAIAIATAAAGLAAALVVHPASSPQRESIERPVPTTGPAALALVSFDGANLGVRRRAVGPRENGRGLVRGSFQLPAL